MRQVFQIVPASSGAAITLAVIAIVLVAMLGLFGYIAWSSRHTRFEVTSEGLRIAGDLYGRLIPAQDLIVADARVIDLNRDSDFAPRVRTNGTGLPGYSSGWFRLKNGMKALAFITDRSHVVYLPTNRGYAVMLSAEQPEELIRALKAGAR
jgi:hypothetical protein